MHYGMVNQDIEPRVNLTVLGPNNTIYDGEFIIDTGYSGEIILPLDIARALNLVRGDDIPVTLGDGTTDDYSTYTARIEWHGRHRAVAVTSVGSEALVGMQLLRDSNLSVDATPGGAVTISELPLGVPSI